MRSDTLPRYRQHVKDEWDRLKEVRKALKAEEAADITDVSVRITFALRSSHRCCIQPMQPGSQIILQLQAEEKAVEALRPKWKALRDKVRFISAMA